MGVKGLALDALHHVFLERVRGSRRCERDRAYDAYRRARTSRRSRASRPGWRSPRRRMGADWRTWPRELRDPTSDAVRDFAREHAARIDFHRWLQFEADRQLGDGGGRVRATRACASGCIRISRSARRRPAPTPGRFPSCSCAARASARHRIPYATQGQNWGLPPLDPRALRRDRYRYFIESPAKRLSACRRAAHRSRARVSSACSGFPTARRARTARMSAIRPTICSAFSRSRACDTTRSSSAKTSAPFPTEVPPALARWGVLSSKVLYFERDYDGGFKPSSSYPPLSLATANTHDMAAIAGFWSGRDIEIRRAVGLIESDDDARRAHDDRDARPRRAAAPPRRGGRAAEPRDADARVASLRGARARVSLSQPGAARRPRPRRSRGRNRARERSRRRTGPSIRAGRERCAIRSRRSMASDDVRRRCGATDARAREHTADGAR